MLMSIVAPLIIGIGLLSVLFISRRFPYFKEYLQHRIKDFEDKAKDFKCKLDEIEDDEKKCDKLEKMIEKDLRDRTA